MAEFQIKKGNVIFSAESRLTFLALIEEGHVLMRLPGTELELSKDDIIGLIDLNTHIHSCDYIALEDTIVETFPCSNFSDFGRLIVSEREAQLIFRGFERQLQSLLDTYTLMRYDCSTMYSYLHNSYSDYCSFCQKALTTPKVLPNLEEFPALSLDEAMDNWKLQYYSDFKELFSTPDTARIKAYPNFYMGLLHFGCQDIQSLLQNFRTMNDYLHDLSYFLINEDSIDFLDLYSSLLITIAKDGNDTLPVTAALSRLMLHIEGIHSIDQQMYQKRLADYNTLLVKLDKIAEHAVDKTYQKQMAATTDLLKNSSDVILAFAAYPDDKALVVKRLLKEYKQLPDRSATTDDVMKLRKNLTAMFYELYTAVFMNSLNSSELPPIVWMFLTFGYLDEEIAGFENATYLYSLFGNFKGDDSRGVYTIYEWLCAIFAGQKQPRKNEFDADYATHINELSRTGNITVAQAEQLLNDPKQKVMFELTNLFTAGNRMTHGRITTFCPIFSDHNVSKSLEECLCTPERISSVLNEIRSIDYSVFYRQTIYVNPEFNIVREFIQTEVLPDVILMPNVGIRGAVWQEIEGKDRTTPATFLLPVFSLENLQLLLTRMSGDFRWEMCRRIQGAKWNDVTDHSLTSDYYDYLQFFRKNNELSTNAKEKCSGQLKKCKNNFKEYFIIDYMCWILYEAKGAPRLNRYARNILFNYCPFSKAIRDTLSGNPLYEQIISKSDVSLVKEKRRLDSLLYRCRKSKNRAPAELEAQRAFLDS